MNHTVEVEEQRVPLAAECRRSLVEDPTRHAERTMLRPLRSVRELESLDAEWLTAV